MIKASLEGNRQNWKDSAKLLENALEIANKGQISDYLLLLTHRSLLEDYTKIGKSEKAIKISEEILSNEKSLSRAMQINFRTIIAYAYVQLNQYEKAEPLLLDIESELIEIEAIETIAFLRTQNRLSSMYSDMQNTNASLNHASKAYQTSLKMFGSNDITTVLLYGSYGLGLLRTENYSDALDVLNFSLEKLLELAGEDAIYKEVFSHAIAQAMIFSGEYDKARSVLGEINIQTLQENQPKMMTSLEISLMKALNDYLQSNDDSLKYGLKEGISQLEGCNCFLRTKLMEMFGESTDVVEVITASE